MVMSHDEWQGIEQMTYECVRCGTQFSGKELAVREQIKCPYCSYHVLKKIRPPIVKRVKAI